VRFTVNGREAGATIHLAESAGKIEIEAEAKSQLPYDRLEIVVNGRVVADSTPSGPLHQARIAIEHPLKESSWIAARAVEDLAPYRAKGVEFSKIHMPRGTRVGDYYGTRRPETVFAHTSPVYVLLEGREIRSRDDADYYIRYMDKSIEWLEKEGKFARPSDKQATLDAFREGRARWLRRRDG
jgi:hypothetical protein